MRNILKHPNQISCTGIYTTLKNVVYWYPSMLGWQTVANFYWYTEDRLLSWFAQANNLTANIGLCHKYVTWDQSAGSTEPTRSVLPIKMYTTFSCSPILPVILHLIVTHFRPKGSNLLDYSSAELYLYDIYIYPHVPEAQGRGLFISAWRDRKYTMGSSYCTFYSSFVFLLLSSIITSVKQKWWCKKGVNRQTS